jgi:glycogen operon protein
VLSQVKLIAEPWDLGEGGYQVGNFPVLWTEWNGKYRDTVRRFWRGDLGQVADLGYRLTGSSDLYSHNGRRPGASINFVTCHDGFTLHDLVSYNRKHNDANGEGNRDGSDNNLSWNCGVEGGTDDEGVLALREQQMRNMLATLFISQGVPMLLHGDEVGRTQSGNNNAYCQDNELAWQSWNIGETEEERLAFATRLIAFRKKHPVLRRRLFFQGRPVRGTGTRDIIWYSPHGEELTDADWQDGGTCVLSFVLAGEAADLIDERGAQTTGDTMLVLLNASPDAVTMALPRHPDGRGWFLGFDTARPAEPEGRPVVEGTSYDLEGRSMAVLVQPALPSRQAGEQGGRTPQRPSRRVRGG